MFESRCGVCCDSCERREKVHCKGCINMEKTFWGGVCEVKVCCEGKELNHCGECPDFPCTMLAEMGKDQGYDPEPRLTQLRKWAEEGYVYNRDIFKIGPGVGQNEQQQYQERTTL